MPMDVATAEAQILGRVGAALQAAGIDVGTVSPLPGLQDPIGFGLALAGVTAADPTAVTDADVALLPASRWYMLVDLASLRLLELVAVNFALMWSREQLPDQSWYRDNGAILKAVEAMRAYVRTAYGVGVPTLQGGSVKAVAHDPERYFYPTWGGRF